MLMKTLFALCALALLPLLFSCGKDPHEAFADDMTTAFDDLTEVLSTIKDKETADQAAPRLEKIAGELKDLMEKGQDLEAPDKKMDPERSKKIQESMRKYAQEMMRVSQIKGASEVIQKALSAMQPEK